MYISVNTSIMKNFRYLFITLLMSLAATLAEAQTVNELVLPNQRMLKGTTQQMVIEMDNSDEVVAIQFDMELPDGFTAQTTPQLSSRCTDHTVTVREVGTRTYRVLLFSPTNAPLLAQHGTVMSLPVSVSASLEEGSEHQPVFSAVTLTSATGANVMTNCKTGKLSIARMPDLVPKNITVTPVTLAPGDELNVSWQVENIGDVATGDGWNERLSLVLSDGSESTLLTTVYHDETLAAHATVSRQAIVNVPALPHLDGSVRVQVTIIPRAATGESVSSQGNNTLMGSDELTLSKMLTLTLDQTEISESGSPIVNAHLTRSGRWTEAQTFQIAYTDDSRVSMPHAVTIAAGQATAAFAVNITDDELLQNVETTDIDITASGNDYAEVTTKLTLTDNELPALTLTASKTEIMEGESFTLTATTNRTPTQPLTVTLTSEDHVRFSFPSQMVIPAGENEAVVTVTTTDDELPALEIANAFTASAPKHHSAQAIVLLKDNDMPALQLTLSPSTVQESAGVMAVAVTLRRTGVTSNKITVHLTDDADGALYFSTRTIIMEKGVEEATFNLGPIDNVLVEGDRNYTITAAVYISSCSCNAQGESAGSVSAQLTVLDNDGPALTLTAANTTLKEGQATTLTLTRNTSTEAPLTVRISSDYDEGMVYEQNVTIPAGQHSIDIPLQALENETEGDSHTVVFTAEAMGFSTGTCWLQVTDQTLPDAQISDIVLSAHEAVVGDSLLVTVTLANQGIVELPEMTKVTLYGTWQQGAVDRLFLQAPLAAGSQTELSCKVGLPMTIGSYDIYAVVNEQRSVQEILYTNNTSERLNVCTKSPFTATLQVDSSTYQPGDSISITGSITGNSIAHQTVEVYIINENYRHTLQVETDENGQFALKYLPYAQQVGHFIAGGCYPGERLTEEMASFDVYGLRLATNGYIECRAFLGDTYHGSFSIVNPCHLPLSNVHVVSESVPSNCIVNLNAPSVVAAGETFQVSFTIDADAVSEPNKWQEIKVAVETQEGARLVTTIYYYCQNNHAQLVASVQDIDLTVTKGSSRDYAFTLTNTGKGETGNISVVIPEWMELLTPTIMPSLATGDTATVVLHITPTEAMAYNVPVSGTIGINAENAQALTLNYRVEPVAEEKGTLTVDVCDEYTYYTNEGPHVAGATVVVKHPYTEAVIAQGVTNADGTFSFELPEGYYKVEASADKHDKQGNYCYVNPGKTETLTFNLSYQAISISWEVEETEVEDQYQIITTMNYETNVPAPVVKITLPERIDGDNMSVGDAVVINMGLTNVGLINAQDVTVALPQDREEWSFEALDHTEPFVLAAHQSVNVPVRITRIADGSAASARGPRRGFEDMPQSYRECFAAMVAYYKHLCGSDLKDNAAAERLAMKACAISATSQAIMDELSKALGFLGGGGGGHVGPGGGGSGGGGGGGGTYIPEIKKTLDICDTCDAQRVEKIVNVALSFTWFSTVNDGLNNAIDAFQKEKNPGYKYVIREVRKNIFEETRDFFIDKFTHGIGSTIYEIIYDVYEYTDICKNSGGGASARRKAQASHSWVQQFDNVALKFVDQLKTADSLINYAYGDHIWFDELDEGKARFMEWVDELPEDYQPTDEELLAHKPESASLTQMRDYVNHINGQGDNLPSVDKLEGLLTTYKQLNDEAKEAGYISLTDQFSASYDNYVERYMNMKRSSVCATISLQLSQEMVMTRQAFRGTLTVFNGHESDAMTDVRLHLEVKNIETGELATSHEMQMNAETLTGFSGDVSLDGMWELGAQATGKATVLFIPTKFAAATTPQRYSFGGTLTYIDPFTELQVTRKLYPVMLTVNPTADIELDYFMQRDIFGDDPLTEGVVEPMHPAEFALIINNKGYGDAKNVRMLTHQPEIIDNEKGLLINFAIVGSQTNGQPASMTLSKDFANDFGTIPSQSQAYAQWWLHSTLLGHFTDYDVQVNHLTSYGNPDLSLVDTARIHELIHGFTVSSQSEPPLRGFLVNELPDAYDQPDSLFFTNATQSSVRMADNASVERLNDTEYMLVITPSVEGWNYGSLSDPTNGRQLLTSIVRQSDGKELSVDNMWQTDRTLRDGEDWLYEKRLHFIVEMGSQQESYRLVFTEDPDAGVLVLNENDMIHPTESHQGDVRLVRSLKRDKWNTLCLPFSMTDEEVRDVWGDNAYVASFNKTEVDNNGDAVLGFLIHNNGIQANVPCLIKPSVDTLNILLHNREVVWEDNPSVTIGDMAFKGNYEAGTQVPVGDYYISEAQFYRSQGYSTMQAYRGWFHDTSVMSGSRRLKMAFDDGNKPTVILWPEDSKKPVVTPRYDIRGIEHTDRPRGIYIEEGRKRVKSATSSN